MIRIVLAPIVAIAGFLALAGAIAAAGPPGSFPFKVSVPKSGHEAIYGYKLTGHVPAGVTFNGRIVVTVQATNGAKMANGVLSAAVVVPTGKLAWDVFLVVDATKASGSGAAAMTGTISLPPFPNLTASVAPLSKDQNCSENELDLKRVASVKAGNEKGFGNLLNWFYWVTRGPSDSAKRTVANARCD